MLLEVAIIILLILAFANLIGSTIGFGDSLIMIPLIGLFISIKTAVVLAGFWSLLLSTINAIKYREFFDKYFVKKYFIPAILGAIVGSSLIVVSPTEWIELSLAIFIFLYIAAKIIEILKNGKFLRPPEQELDLKERSMDSIPTSVFCIGSLSFGIVSGLIGAAGPINVMLLERTGHERESFIQNFAVASIITGSFKVIIYSYNSLFPVDMIWVFLIGFGVIYIAARAGHWLTPKIPKEKFQLLVLIMLFIIAIRLIFSFSEAIQAS